MSQSGAAERVRKRSAGAPRGAIVLLTNRPPANRVESPAHALVPYIHQHPS